MAGYKGYSMSNNAVAAYDDGEKPLSKWTKSEIIDELEILNDDVSAGLKKMTGAQVKSEFLEKSSWHHTSKMYNRTNFYSIKELDAEEVAEIVNKYFEIKALSEAKERFSKIKFTDVLKIGSFNNCGEYQNTIKIEQDGSFLELTVSNEDESVEYRKYGFKLENGDAELVKYVLFGKEKEFSEEQKNAFRKHAIEIMMNL